MAQLPKIPPWWNNSLSPLNGQAPAGPAPITIDQVDPNHLVLGRPEGNYVTGDGPEDNSAGSDPIADLLAGISRSEGTDDAAVTRSRGLYSSGYDVTFGNNRFGTPSKPVSQMTLDEVNQYQNDMLNNPANTGHTSAVGRYQIVGRTLRGLRREMGLDGSEIFSPDLQDKMARRLLEESGLNAYQAGKITPEQFQDRLANQWDSIATPGTGQTRHGGRLGMTSRQAQEYLSRIPRNR